MTLRLLHRLCILVLSMLGDLQWKHPDDYHIWSDKFTALASTISIASDAQNNPWPDSP